MQEMDDIAVANRDGRTITIGDLGHAEDSTEEIESAALYNDTPCVLLNIRKQSGTNTVEVVDAAEGAARRNSQDAARRTTRVEVVRDQSIFIEPRSTRSRSTWSLGGAAGGAWWCFCFLANIRATIIAALSIPTSIIAAFAIVNYMGFTLNSITLLALTLSVGIVIDDAIVVMENIFRYIEEKKYTPFEAAIAATTRNRPGRDGDHALAGGRVPADRHDGEASSGRFLKSFGITMAARSW